VPLNSEDQRRRDEKGTNEKGGGQREGKDSNMQNRIREQDLSSLDYKE